MKQQFLYWCKKALVRSKAVVAFVLAFSIITFNGQFLLVATAQETTPPTTDEVIVETSENTSDEIQEMAKEDPVDQEPSEKTADHAEKKNIEKLTTDNNIEKKDPETTETEEDQTGDKEEQQTEEPLLIEDQEASALLIKFPPIQAPKGSITVCKIILDAEGNVVEGTTGSEFSISVTDEDDNPVGVAVFSTPLTFNENLLTDDSGQDAECVTFGDLPLSSNPFGSKTYHYGQELIDPESNWEVVLYNDKFDVPVPLENAATEAFGTSDSSDGNINLTFSKKHRKLLVVNTLKKAAEEESCDSITANAWTDESPVTLPDSDILLKSEQEPCDLGVGHWEEVSIPGGAPVIDTPDTAWTSISNLTVPGTYTYKLVLHGFNHETGQWDGPVLDEDEVTFEVLPALLSTVTICKVDEAQQPLEGWTLMLKGDHVEDLNVPANLSSGIDSGSLFAGVSYIAKSVGTWLNQGGANIADAEYSTTDTWATHMDGYTGYQSDILELQIGSMFDPDSDWGTYNSAHTYAQSFTPAVSGGVNFRIFDGSGTTQNEGWFGDNSGELAVSIYEGYSGITEENGCVTFEDVPYGEYVIDEVMQDDWENVSGLGEVTIDEPEASFTVVNSFEDGNNGEETATISATKIVCDAETYLPNWGLDEDNPTVTATTAAEFLAAGDNAEHCWLQEGWKFEWAPDGTNNPGDNIIGTAGGAWTETGVTAADGTVTFDVPAGDDLVWVREQMQPGYYPFAGSSTEDDMSAEIHCNTDSFNYDNVEWISPRADGETYHCVAFNVEKRATVSATKIVCPTEADLPNWGLDDDNGIVTATTAAEFLATHPACYVQEGWKFEWAPEGTNNPGDNTEAAGAPWTETGVTAVDGTITFDVPVGTGLVWVREQLKDGYIPFTGDAEDASNVSAELHCNTDSLHYDNFEWIATLEEGKTYHCVAFNAPVEEPLQCIDEPEGSWADGVEDVDQGKRKDGSAIAAARSDATKALGESDWNPGGSSGFFSLGFGGSITLSFNSFVPDVTGTDIFIHEATNGGYPLETVDVEVSQNGADWQLAGTADNTGLTKITEIDFSGTGLPWIKYVRLTDTSNPALFTNDADGFDLDAVEVAKQQCEEPVDMCTNIDGLQTEVPDGLIQTDAGQCVEDGGGEQGEDTEETIVVDSDSQNGWVFADDNDSPPSLLPDDYVTGPGTPLFGDGSAHLAAATTSDRDILVKAFSGFNLSDITELSYHTYQASTSGAPAIAFQFNIDDDVTDSDTNYKGRLVYEPYYTHSISTGSWQEWDTMDDSVDGSGNGNWWFSNETLATNSGCSISNPCTWTEVLAAFPNAGPHSLYGAALFKAGGGWTGFDGNVDGFVIGIQSGLDTHTTTYDFEPLPAEPLAACADGINNDGEEDSLVDEDDPGCHTDGDANNSGSYDPEDDDETDPLAPQQQSSNNTGGGGSSGSSGFKLASLPQPQVLGESTDTYCEEYIKSYIKLGAQNNKDDVTRLQQFLNEHLSLNLTVDGVYGKSSFNAVKQFQVKYFAEVLNPWKQFGNINDAGTGYVYKTTRRWINHLKCPDLNLPIPPLP